MNIIYPKAKEQMLVAGLDLTGTVKAALVDGYAYSSGDQVYTAIASYVIGTPAALTNMTYGIGIFNADDPVFSGVTGAEADAVVIYIDSGVEATSPLVAYIDAATGLPFTPSGGSATLSWNASGIFQL